MRRVEMRSEVEGGFDKLSVDDMESWEDDGPNTPLLDTINYPVHLKVRTPFLIPPLSSPAPRSGGRRARPASLP